VWHTVDVTAHIVHSTPTQAVDLTAAAVMAQAQISAAGDDAVIQPVGSASVEVIPLTTRIDMQISAWTGDIIDGLAQFTATPQTATILMPAGKGWVIPGPIVDRPNVEAARDIEQNALQTVTLALNPSGAPELITHAAQLVAGKSVTPVGTTAEIWATTAGTVGGKAVKVGRQELTGLTAGSALAVVDAAGWLIETVPDAFAA